MTVKTYSYPVSPLPYKKRTLLKRNMKKRLALYIQPPALPSPNIPAMALPTGGTAIIQHDGKKVVLDSSSTCCIDTTLMTWTVLASQSPHVHELLDDVAKGASESAHFAKCIQRLMAAASLTGAMQARAYFFMDADVFRKGSLQRPLHATNRKQTRFDIYIDANETYLAEFFLLPFTGNTVRRSVCNQDGCTDRVIVIKFFNVDVSIASTIKNVSTNLTLHEGGCQARVIGGGKVCKGARTKNAVVESYNDL